MPQNTLYNEHGAQLSQPIVDTSEKQLDLSPAIDAFSEKYAKQARQNLELGTALLMREGMREAYNNNKTDAAGFMNAYKTAVTSVTSQLPADEGKLMQDKLMLGTGAYLARIENNKLSEQDDLSRVNAGKAVSEARTRMRTVDWWHAVSTSNEAGIKAFGDEYHKNAEAINKTLSLTDSNGNTLLSREAVKIATDRDGDFVTGAKELMQGMDYKERERFYTEQFRNRELIKKQMSGLSDEAYDKIDAMWTAQLKRDKADVEAGYRSEAQVAVADAWSRGLISNDEDLQYLTDEDKEWVERAGKIATGELKADSKGADFVSKRAIESRIKQIQAIVSLAKSKERDANMLASTVIAIENASIDGHVAPEEKSAIASTAVDLMKDPQLASVITEYEPMFKSIESGLSRFIEGGKYTRAKGDSGDDVHAKRRALLHDKAEFRASRNLYHEAKTNASDWADAQIQGAINVYRATGDLKTLKESMGSIQEEFGLRSASFLAPLDKLRTMKAGDVITWNGRNYTFKGRNQFGTLLFE